LTYFWVRNEATTRCLCGARQIYALSPDKLESPAVGSIKEEPTPPLSLRKVHSPPSPSHLSLSSLSFHLSRSHQLLVTMQAQRDHLNRNAGDVEIGVSFRFFRKFYIAAPADRRTSFTRLRIFSARTKWPRSLTKPLTSLLLLDGSLPGRSVVLLFSSSASQNSSE